MTKKEFREIAVNSNLVYDTTPNEFIDANGLAYFKKKFEKQLMEKLAAVPTFEHKCNNCGGTLEMKTTEHIFKCPYCGSVYAIGTAMIHDKEGGT